MFVPSAVIPKPRVSKGGICQLFPLHVELGVPRLRQCSSFMEVEPPGSCCMGISMHIMRRSIHVQGPR